MKGSLFIVGLLVMSLGLPLVAEKECFKKKRTLSTRKMAEQWGQELADTMEKMPKLQRQLAKQQKELARLEDETRVALTHLIENDQKIDKEELECSMDEAEKLNEILQTQIQENEKRIAKLRTLGKPKTKTVKKESLPEPRT
jgi:hypothetical protein